MKFYILFVLITFSILKVFGQDINKKSIRGIVVDSATQHPVKDASIDLKDFENKPYKTIKLHKNGSFKFENLTAGKYSISIIAVGYTLKKMAIDLSDTSKKTIDFYRVTITSISKRKQ